MIRAFGGRRFKYSPALIGTILGSLLLWTIFSIIFGSNYPLNYDSINYALGIVDDFDIGKCQPHAYGYVYHILVSRLWLPFIENPFRIQQAQNILYLLFALLCMVPPDKKSSCYLLLPATVPLSLYFSATSVIHAVSFTASAAIANLILRLEERRISPVLLTGALAVFVGFRQDLALFMGPVVFVALLRFRCSTAEWVTIVVSGVGLTGAWYFGTSVSSAGLSPWKEANHIVRPFLEASSILYGASPIQSLRGIIRLILYVPAVLGPGGLFFIGCCIKQFDNVDRLYFIAAAVPFFLYGILFYLGVPSYLSTVTGFAFAWPLLRGRVVMIKPLVLMAALSNILFFLFIPAPLTEGYGEFSSRSIGQSILKQCSYFGAVGYDIVSRNREFEQFLDIHVRRCAGFSVIGRIDYNGIPYWRIWDVLAQRVWHNNHVSSPDSASCIIGYINAMDIPPHQKIGTIGVWYAK